MAFSTIENDYYLYVLYGSKDQEIRYVGVTYRPERRYQDHILNSKKLKTYRDKWINKILSEDQSLEMFVFQVIDYEDISKEERFWIKCLRELGCNLTNHTSGGEGMFAPDEETIEKIRSKQIGIKRKPLTKEHKDKLSIIHKGTIFTPERCKNISKAKKGVKFSEEHKAKLAAAKIGVKRKPFTEETLNRMRLAQQKRLKLTTT